MVAVFLLAASGSACSDGQPSGSPEDGFRTEDSAGVAIFSTDAPVWGRGEGWRVSDAPALQIGSVEGDSSRVVYRVRDAVRLSDGRVVVAEGSSNRIRYFGPDGDFLYAVGGQGDGPGEYRALREIRRLPGDSLLAFDLLNARVTLLDEAGALVETVRLRGDGRSRLLTNAVFRLDGGGFIGSGGWSTGQIGDLGPGLYRPTSTALRFAADGSLEDTVAVYPSADMAVMSIFAPPVPGLPASRHRINGLTLFSRITSTAIRDGRLYVGTAESLEVRVYDASGRLVRILRGPTPDLTITPEEVDAQQAARRGDSDDPDVRAYFDALFEAMPLPESKPAYEEIFVDPSGSVWLSPFEGEIESDDPWMVFGADGRFLGEVAMPPSIEVLDIDEEYVVALWHDELGVEYLRLYPIEREGAGG